MRVLITGGAGFIGSHLVDECLKAKHDITVVDNFSHNAVSLEGLPIKLSRSDIRDRKALSEVFAEVEPELVFHLAAHASVSESVANPVYDFMVNVFGTINVLEECVKHKAKLVFASTAASGSPYAAAKASAEEYVDAYRQTYGLKATVLRYANVYGPRQRGDGEAGVVAIFAENIKRGKAITINARQYQGDGGCLRDYVYVGDVVRATLLSAPENHHLLEIGTGILTSTERLADKMMNTIDIHVQKNMAPRRSGDIQQSGFGKGDLGNLIGNITPLRGGLELTLKETACVS